MPHCLGTWGKGMCGPGNLLGVTWPLSYCSVNPNHVLVDSLCCVRVCKLFSRSIHYNVESRTTPLLTEDKASSLTGKVCPFHPLSALELTEKAKGFCYVHCHEKMCFTLAPTSEWKEDTIEWIAHHAHSDVKQYAAQKKRERIVCFWHATKKSASFS